jgi:hypothetical protein
LQDKHFIERHKEKELPMFAGWFSLFLIATAVVIITFNESRIIFYRRKGIYPKKGQATIKDVETLLKYNQKSLAVRCYREATNANFLDAKKAVDLMVTKL